MNFLKTLSSSRLVVILLSFCTTILYGSEDINNNVHHMNSHFQIQNLNIMTKKWKKIEGNRYAFFVGDQKIGEMLVEPNSLATKAT